MTTRAAAPGGAAAPAPESEAARHADFTSILRYAQVWEDADILLEGLDPRPGDICLSIASAGDNALSLLTRDPELVIAVDLNPAQFAALELRMAAYRELAHGELLELVGSRPSTRRPALYAACRPLLPPAARDWWDARPAAIAGGIGGAGRFERYFALFRRWLLPLVHGRRTVEALFEPRDRNGRLDFFERHWDTARWRLLFRAFFSQTLMGRLGRDPSFFRYVEGSLANHLRGRVRHGLVELEPAGNPYLQWILTGEHRTALPHALRPEHFEVIRSRLDRVRLRRGSLESVVASGVAARVDRANLSDIFEYMSAEHATALLESLVAVAPRGSRFAYWNMMVPRTGAELLPDRLRALGGLSRELFLRDKAIFYRAFIVEEVR